MSITLGGGGGESMGLLCPIKERGLSIARRIVQY